jgi:hypothetical protein
MTEIEAEKSKSTIPAVEELDGMIEMVRYVLDAYGNFAEKLGTIQRDHKDAFDAMMSPSSIMQLPDMLSKLSEKNPELNNLLTKIFIKMSTFLPQIGNLMNLTAEEKIKLGINLKSTSKDIDALLDLTKVKVE